MTTYTLIDGIGHIKISSGKGNLLGTDDFELIHQVISTNDSQIRGLIITGDDNCFSTGAAAAQLGVEELSDFFQQFDTLLLALFTYPKPVVAAVNGHSIGGGLLLQCCADYIVAASDERIKIGLPELKIGLTIDELMTSLLKFNLGNVRVIQDLLYCGGYKSVQQSIDMGLTDKSVPAELLDSCALTELNRLLEFNSKAFRTTKLRLRAHSIGRMKAALSNKCYEIFETLK